MLSAIWLPQEVSVECWESCETPTFSVCRLSSTRGEAVWCFSTSVDNIGLLERAVDEQSWGSVTTAISWELSCFTNLNRVTWPFALLANKRRESTHNWISFTALLIVRFSLAFDFSKWRPVFSLYITWRLSPEACQNFNEPSSCLKNELNCFIV